MRHGLVLAMAVLTLVVGLGMGYVARERERITKPLEQMVPASCSFYIRSRELSAHWEHMERSALVRFFKQHRYRKMQQEDLFPDMSGLEQALEEIPALCVEVFNEPNLSDFLGQNVIVAGRSPGAGRRVQWVLLLETRGRGFLAGRLADRLLEHTDNASVLRARDFFLSVRGNRLMIGNDLTLVAEASDLAASRSAEAMKMPEFPFGKHLDFSFDLRRMQPHAPRVTNVFRNLYYALSGGMPPMPSPEGELNLYDYGYGLLRFMMDDVLDVRALTQWHGSGELAAEGLVLTSRFETDSKRLAPYAAEQMLMEPMAFDVLGYLPQETLCVWANRVDFVALLDELKRDYLAEGSGTEAEWNGELEKFEQRLDKNIRTEFFQYLGPIQGVAVIWQYNRAVMGEIDLMIPPTLYFAKMTNADVRWDVKILIDETLRDMEKERHARYLEQNQRDPQGYPLEAYHPFYLGTQIEALDEEIKLYEIRVDPLETNIPGTSNSIGQYIGADKSFKPGYAFIGDYIFFTTYYDSLKRVVKAWRGEKPLSRFAENNPGLKHLNKPCHQLYWVHAGSLLQAYEDLAGHLAYSTTKTKEERIEQTAVLQRRAEALRVLGFLGASMVYTSGTGVDFNATFGLRDEE